MKSKKRNQLIAIWDFGKVIINKLKFKIMLQLFPVVFAIIYAGTKIAKAKSNNTNNNSKQSVLNCINKKYILKTPKIKQL